MQCLSAIQPGCAGTATHMLVYSLPDPHDRDAPRRRRTEPVCKPCGELAYRRWPALKARVVPLHVHTPDSSFIATVEGHRLVKDPEHEARCFDCGTTGTPNWFAFQTNGCPARPESITVLYKPRESLGDSTEEWALESARLWWGYAVEHLGMHVEDWRPVGEATYGAYFTFRDREYAVQHTMPGGRFGAVKLPNRGRPSPQLINGDLHPYNQVVFSFHNRVTDSGSEYFATWTPGHANIADRYLINLYTPEGTVVEVLYVPGLRSWAETTGAIADAFGPISRAKLQTRIYE